MNVADAAVALPRTIVRAARCAGVAADVEIRSSTRWASATFTGARHELRVSFDRSGDALRWLRALPEADLPVTGHLVADLKIVALDHVGARSVATLEVLTVEDR